MIQKYSAMSASGNPVCVRAPEAELLCRLKEVYHTSTAFYLFWSPQLLLPVGRVTELGKLIQKQDKILVEFVPDPLGVDCFQFTFALSEAPPTVRAPVPHLFPRRGVRRAQVRLKVDGWLCDRSSLVKKVIADASWCLKEFNKLKP